MNNNTILIVILILLSIIFLFGIIKYFLSMKKKKKIDTEVINKNDNLEKKTFINEDNFNKLEKSNLVLQERLEKNIKEYEENNFILQNKITTYSNKIAETLKEDKELLKKELITILKKDLKKETEFEIKEAKKTILETKDQLAVNILLETIENISEGLVIEKTITMIDFDNEEFKGRIIGKEGRNKNTFELLTGVDLIIEKNSKHIILSSLNSVRREIARILFDEIIKHKNLDPDKIGLLYNKALLEFETNITEIGEDTILNKLKFKDMDPKIYPYVGKLKYRSSFGQNILNHSIEVANLASHIAVLLNIDSEKAAKAAFFHDIGKSIDYEINENHVNAGIKIAQECNFDDYIINAIESHHNDIITDNIYSDITKIVDMISAARPGARLENHAKFIERVTELEKLCENFEEIEKAFVVKHGRHLRVIVNPNVCSDENMFLVSQKIKKLIEENDRLKTFKVKVTFLRESKISFETNIYNSKKRS
jgi:ribonuclease Y